MKYKLADFKNLVMILLLDSLLILFIGGCTIAVKWCVVDWVFETRIEKFDNKSFVYIYNMTKILMIASLGIVLSMDITTPAHEVYKRFRDKLWLERAVILISIVIVPLIIIVFNHNIVSAYFTGVAIAIVAYVLLTQKNTEKVAVEEFLRIKANRTHLLHNTEALEAVEREFDKEKQFERVEKMSKEEVQKYIREIERILKRWK